MSSALALLIAGALIGILAAVVVNRVRHATRKVRAKLRRWGHTRLTVTQTPRKAKARKGARR